MDLTECRNRIDEIDRQLVALFSERMETAAQIAAYKKEHRLPVLDAERERQKLHQIAELAPEALQDDAETLYRLLFELSRSYQRRLLGSVTPLPGEIRQAIDRTPELFPVRATIACQGVEGAYSQLACGRLFRTPDIFYFSNFEAVFAAVDKGLCRYGVIPLENSAAGSVNAVYDLMMRYNFRIVRSVRLKVDHNLLALPGATLGGIREIYSHEQAISQCSRLLQSMPNVKVVRCANTAEAAKFVADSGRTDVAALASRSCANLYELNVLSASVQDQGSNFTRFICISKELEIYPGADRTSLMMTLPHKPGALSRVLSRFYALGVNLNKLESRPLPDRNFEFMFYFDLECPVYAPQFLQLMGELEEISENCSYLGSYSEVV